MRKRTRIHTLALALVLMSLGLVFTAGLGECGGSLNLGGDVGGPGGGGGPAPATPTPPAAYTTLYRSGTNEFHTGPGGGAYGGSLTVIGYTHTVVGNINRVLDVNTGHTTGIEYCIGTTPNTDWDSFGQLPPSGFQVSPDTVSGSGTYANGLLDCLLGQFITGHYWYWWENATNPTIEPMDIEPPNGDPEWGNFGYTRCLVVLDPPQHFVPPGTENNICGQFPG